jgi:nucleoside permease NupC
MEAIIISCWEKKIRWRIVIVAVVRERILEEMFRLVLPLGVGEVHALSGRVPELTTD